jgi:Zn-dependent M28 family amino/carboxypeptidase
MHLSLRAATAAAAAAACALAVAAAPASAATPTDSSSLRSAITAKNVKKHMSALQTIANMNDGTRASGTPGYDASLAYVKSKLDATGYYTTTVQPFVFDAFRELATPVFQRISPSPRDFVANEDFITMDYSDTGDVTGTLVATNDIVIPHLDSVQEGPGINDNGSGTASDLEIALQMARLKVNPTNQVMFAFWGAEESGLIGSQFYVDSFTSRQVKDTAVNLNFDMVGSPNFVRFVYDGDASDTASLASTGSGVVEDVFLDYFASQSLPAEPTAFDGRSDYDAFISVGIPAGGLFAGAEDVKTAEQPAIYGGTAGVAYDPCYHQACDTIDNVSMTALDQMSDASAHATLTFAQSGSAVEGTDKGKALGHGEHKGSRLRR